MSPFGTSLKTSHTGSAPFSAHPNPNQEDLTLHRFFSLHRPFLLLNQPTSALFTSAPGIVEGSDIESPFISTASNPIATIDNPPVATAEADADAARQLSRALVMNRVGNLVNWQETLARLGVHEVDDAVSAAMQEVNMDSTKRKRRKKMKKHKSVVNCSLYVQYADNVLIVTLG